MQFMPATARSLGIDPSDPFASIDAAGRYLAGHLKTFGSVSLALAAYNAGAGNVKKYGGIPPFAETQNYVKKITADLGSAA
jgi:soluble lytic murein transglycosylase-like protein